MFTQDHKASHPSVCQFIPGYAYYSGLGYSLAESLVNIVEWFIGLRR